MDKHGGNLSSGYALFEVVGDELLRMRARIAPPIRLLLVRYRL
jgi:hypothetical protein